MNKLPCVHQLEKLGTIKVSCADKQKFSPVHKCEVFKRCLPFFRGPWGEPQRENEAKNYALCHSRTADCPRYVATASLLPIAPT